MSKLPTKCYTCGKALSLKPKVPGKRRAGQCGKCQYKSRSLEVKTKVVADGKQRRWDLKIIAAGRPPGGSCELCGAAFVDWATLATPSRDTPCFDHDHVTGKFRGWLCVLCNAALGMAKDSPELLRRMADYLDRNRR